MNNNTMERHFTTEDYLKISKLNVNEQSTLLHIFEECVRTRPKDLCCLFPIPPANDAYEHMTFERLWTVSDKLFGKIVHRVPRRTAGFASLLDEHGTRPVIGLLSDNNPYSLLIMIALMRCDVTILMLSTRNSLAGLESLCNETSATCILTTAKWSSKFTKSNAFTFISYTELTLGELDALPPSGIALRPSRPNELYETPFIYHSSGSTRHPSPIRQTNLACLIVAESLRDSSAGRTRGVCVSPLYHAFGLFAIVAPCLAGTAVPAMMLSSSLPPKISQLMDSVKAAQVEILATVPIMYELMIGYLADHPEDWKYLQGVKCTYGGAALPEKVARSLRSHGVDITSGYGSTEAGFGMMGPGDDTENLQLDERWKLLFPNKYLSFKMVAQSEDPATYELIILSDSPCFLEAFRNCEEGYATRDLFSPGPLRDSWVFKGRRDDTLVHVNGEKTNALAMENCILSTCSIVSRAAVVGAGKPRTAVLIQLAYPDCESVEDVRAEVVRAVRAANKESPNHSEIMEEMILILPKGQTIPITAKGNVQRGLVNKLYSAEIGELYAGKKAAKKSTTAMVKPKNSSPGGRYHTEQAVRHHLIDKVSTLLSMSVDDLEIDTHTSLFDLGLTSQMALSLHETLQELCGHELSANHLFEYSSIDALVTSLVPQSMAASGPPAEDERVSKLRASQDSMRSILEAYRASISDIASILPPVKGRGGQQTNFAGRRQVILITGATGALGCHLTTRFLHDIHVAKVYAMVRGVDVARRLTTSAAKRGLCLTDGLRSGRLEALSYDMNDGLLGLSREKYDQLSCEVTHVIHNAWKMNFNLKVADFNKDCIRGTFNLLKFCLLPIDSARGERKEFGFVSSVSAICNYPSTSIPARVIPDDQVCLAMPMGYGQSKCVTELMVESAAKEWGLTARIFRCGQLSGDTHLGVWTPTDLVALLTIGGGVRLGEIPNLCFDASFAPMDIAAGGIRELMSAPVVDNCRVFHISNPNGAEWSDWLRVLREEGIDFRTVTTSQFLRDIKEHPDNECNLVASFLEKLPDAISEEGFTASKLDMSESVEESPTLRNCPLLTADLTAKYLGYWRSIGLIR